MPLLSHAETVLNKVASNLEPVERLEADMEKRRPLQLGEVAQQKFPRFFQGLAERSEVKDFGLLELGDQTSLLICMVATRVFLHLKRVCLQLTTQQDARVKSRKHSGRALPGSFSLCGVSHCLARSCNGPQRM